MIKDKSIPYHIEDMAIRLGRRMQATGDASVYSEFMAWVEIGNYDKAEELFNKSTAEHFLTTGKDIAYVR